MVEGFEIIRLEMDDATIAGLSPRVRNQLAGCMHAHNELTILNRLLIFAMNDFGDGDLHDDAQSVQVWTIQQMLAGKLFETWNMIDERFLNASPRDPALKTLSVNEERSLAWLINYFGIAPPKKPSAIKTIRDKTAFHYDKLNLEESSRNLAPNDHRIYLAQHPANGLYFVGSSLVFRSIFAKIADEAGGSKDRSHVERVQDGARIAMKDLEQANIHMHQILYGLMKPMLESAYGCPLEDVEQVRIPVVGAPRTTDIALPAFLNIGRDQSEEDWS